MKIGIRWSVITGVALTSASAMASVTSIGSSGVPVGTGEIPASISSVTGPNGIRGGAQIVDVDSDPELVDLATRAVCDMQSGEQVVNNSPAFELRVIAPLKKLDWYFADELMSEAKFLHFCFTGPLRRESTRDRGSPVRSPFEPGAQQIAYRFNDLVFIDSELFNDPNMSDYTRAYVLLHEVMQSYIPMWAPNRSLTLRSIVKDISRVDSGEITTRRDLHARMQMNGIDFPTTVDDLDNYHSSIEFLLEPATKQEGDLTTLPSIDPILNVPQSIIQELAPWHRCILGNLSPAQILFRAYLSRLTDETPDGFSSLLKDPRFAELNPVLLVYASFDQLSVQKQQLFLTSGALNVIYQTVFKALGNVSLSTDSEGRAVVDTVVSEALGITTENPTALLDLPLDPVLPDSFRAVAQIIVRYAIAGRWDLVSGFAGPGTPFDAMIGLQPIHAAIQGFQFNYPVELVLGDRRVDLVSQQLKILFTTELKALLPSDIFNHVLNLIPTLSQNS